MNIISAHSYKIKCRKSFQKLDPSLRTEMPETVEKFVDATFDNRQWSNNASTAVCIVNLQTVEQTLKFTELLLRRPRPDEITFIKYENKYICRVWWD